MTDLELKAKAKQKREKNILFYANKIDRIVAELDINAYDKEEIAQDAKELVILTINKLNKQKLKYIDKRYICQLIRDFIVDRVNELNNNTDISLSKIDVLSNGSLEENFAYQSVNLEMLSFIITELEKNADTKDVKRFKKVYGINCSEESKIEISENENVSPNVVINSIERVLVSLYLKSLSEYKLLPSNKIEAIFNRKAGASTRLLTKELKKILKEYGDCQLSEYLFYNDHDSIEDSHQYIIK